MSPWQRTYWTIWTANLITALGMMSFLPFFPVLLRELGVEGDEAVATWTGVLFGAAPLAADRIDGLEGVGRQTAIGVQEQQVVVAGSTRPGVHLRPAPRGRVQHLSPGLAGALAGAIAAAAVDDDDFGDAAEYIQRGERFRQCARFVEGRDDHRIAGGAGVSLGWGRIAASRGLC